MDPDADPAPARPRGTYFRRTRRLAPAGKRLTVALAPTPDRAEYFRASASPPAIRSPGPAAAGPHRAGVGSRAVRRPSHAGSPAARSVRCAPSPPGPRLPAVLSTAGSRQVPGRDSLRGSASPAAIRSPGPAARGRGAAARLRVVRRPSHAGSPAARSVPLRCTLHLAPGSPPCCPRPARAPSGAARDLPATYRPRRAAGVDPRPPPPLARGRGCAPRPVPGRVPRGTCAGSDTPLPRPPGPLAALPLHLAPGLDGVSFGELCGLRGRRPTLPRSRACGPRGGFLFFPF